MSESGQGMPRTKKSIEHTGFKTIETIGKLVLHVVLRCWRACSAAMLTLLLLYWLYGGVVSFLLLTAAVLGALYHYQDTLLYFPDQPETSRVYVQNPTVLGLPFENLYLKTQDGVKINAIFIKQSPQFQSSVPTMLFFHGNAGNVGHRLINAKSWYNYCGCNVFLVEYRGYGKSDGSPSEQGFELDSQAALSYLISRNDIDTSKIVIFGRSLGGAVAINLASNELYLDKAFALILENTFTSIPSMADQLVMNGISKLPYFCFRNKYDSLRKIRKARVPTLFLSGLADQLIPPRMMTSLYKSSGSCLKKLECFDRGTHNETWQCYGYFDAIARFLCEVRQAREAGVIGPLAPDDPSVATTSSKPAVLNVHSHTEDII
ncbi:protein ABHD13-like [Montipora capricornis]|uniref:protein ABHD13-like n=1 Tax=Montipora foliosa TaxID=591990 RepID=UPI0035F1433C